MERSDLEEARRRDDFERFALRASPTLLRSAYLLTRDHTDAEDLLQATLLRVARHWETIESSPEGYAYRVLVNLARDDRRNRGRRPVEGPESERSPDFAGDPMQQLIERDAMAVMVRRLPAKQREVIVLRFSSISRWQTRPRRWDAHKGPLSHTHRAPSRPCGGSWLQTRLMIVG